MWSRVLHRLVLWKWSIQCREEWGIGGLFLDCESRELKLV